MKNSNPILRYLFLIVTLAASCISLQGCKEVEKEIKEEVVLEVEKPEYFNLRPETEKAYGYTHAIKIGNDIKISGAVSMDDSGNPTAVGDFEQQMKNCYSDLEKILKHYGYSFENVIVENIYTTNMPLLLEYGAYRGTIYNNNFPTGSWIGVKELALPEFMIEIEMEAHKME